MGPSPEGDGKWEPVELLARSRWASMGPSPEGDGKGAQWWDNPIAQLLQWGRHPRATERNVTTELGSQRDHMLQWGRHPRATESQAHLLGIRGRPIASMGPSPEGDGKPKAPSSSATTSLWLQWGRHPRATERREVRQQERRRHGFNGAVTRGRRKGTMIATCLCGSRFASMGPSPEGDGKRGTRCWRRSTCRRFNGAVTRGRRKVVKLGH